MKILYVAHHGQNNNDDEGAIYRGLTELGHTVFSFNFISLQRDKFALCHLPVDDFDIVLFHKLPVDYAHFLCNRWKGVCWFFDPINKGFPANDSYVDAIKDHLYKGFFTDGDYVLAEHRENFYDLKQGFDAADTIDLVDINEEPENDLLFIGTVGQGGYSQRSEYISELEKEFGPIAHTEYSIFKDDLTKKCRNTKIMLAMPPVTDYYWSNRIYLLGGRGAFVLHPDSRGLTHELIWCVDMYPSNDMEYLKWSIKFWLDPENRYMRNEMRKNLQRDILDNHCYIHRCEELVRLCSVSTEEKQ